MLEFLGKSLGRGDDEGFDLMEATVACRRRAFNEVSNMPVVIIASTRDTGERDVNFIKLGFSFLTLLVGFRSIFCWYGICKITVMGSSLTMCVNGNDGCPELIAPLEAILAVFLGAKKGLELIRVEGIPELIGALFNSNLEIICRVN